MTLETIVPIDECGHVVGGISCQGSDLAFTKRSRGGMQVHVPPPNSQVCQIAQTTNETRWRGSLASNHIFFESRENGEQAPRGYYGAST